MQITITIRMRLISSALFWNRSRTKTKDPDPRKEPSIKSKLLLAEIQ